MRVFFGWLNEVAMRMILIGLLAVLSTGPADASAKPLKDVYSRDFQIGVALNGRYFYQPYSENREELEMVRREFNSVTSENFMNSSRWNWQKKISLD